MTADGVAANVMVGIGETYLPAFVLAISSSQVACGLVATVPMLIGAVLQLCTPWAVRRIGSYRRWVVLAAVVQALGFLPLVAAAIVGTLPLTATFLIVAVYWASGMAGASVWNAWAGTLVPERIRAPYFARRSRFTQSGIMVGLAAGGIVLEFGKGWGLLTQAFGLLFVAAAVGRLASAFFLSRQGEPIPPANPKLPKPGELLDGIRHNTESRVLLYMLANQAACYIASPYFNPYMLGQLQLSYVHYLILICTPYVTRVVCLPAWGRIMDGIGPRRVLWLGGLMVGVLPVMWNFSDSFAVLVAVQIFAGLGWAGYELAQLLLFFDTIPTERRVGVLTVYNFFNALAIFGGSILGGLLLSELGAGRDAYWMLFLLSTVARVGALGVLTRLPGWTARPRIVAEPAKHGGQVRRLNDDTTRRAA
jgi:MFS family permease